MGNRVREHRVCKQIIRTRAKAFSLARVADNDLLRESTLASTHTFFNRLAFSYRAAVPGEFYMVCFHIVSPYGAQSYKNI